MSLSNLNVYTIIIIFSLLLVESNRRVTKSNKDTFHRSTYGGNIRGLDPYKPTTTQTYKKHVNQEVKCHGPYCFNGQYGCGSKSDTRSCYNVEHIIDRNGPESADYARCKDVPGNMIMSYGPWNQQLGGIARKSYQTSLDEKTAVYGIDLINSARSAIQRCIRARYVLRTPLPDFSYTWPDNDTIDVGDGIFIIPQGSNFTFRGVDIASSSDQTLTIADVDCDLCAFYPFVDETFPDLIAIIVVTVTISLLIGMTIGAIIMTVALRKKTPYSKVETQLDTI